MSTFSLRAKHVRTGKKPRMAKKDEPREGVRGPNGIANSHFDFQRIAARGDRKYKTGRKWSHRRRQLIGRGDLKEGRKVP